MRGTRLFLLEFILCALVFALAATVCTGVFYKAGDVSRRAEALSVSVAQVQAVAEAFKSGASHEEMAALTGGAWRGGVLYVNYDGELAPVESGGVYLLTCKPASKAGYLAADVAMARGAEEIFALSVCRFVGAEVTP